MVDAVELRLPTSSWQASDSYAGPVPVLKKVAAQCAPQGGVGWPGRQRSVRIAAGAERPQLALHPAAQPTAPAGLELSLALPPHTALLVSWGFEKASLPLAWYPPDAHRGFELPGPVVTVQVCPRTLLGTTWAFGSSHIRVSQSSQEMVAN